MGNLKPKTTYIYEKADGITYAREAGSDPATRQIIGSDHPVNPKYTTEVYEQMIETRKWTNIRKAALTNSALQKALDNVILIYNLSKEFPDE